MLLFAFLGMKAICPKITHDKFITIVVLRRPLDVRKAFAFRQACIKLFLFSPKVKILILPGVTELEGLKLIWTSDNFSERFEMRPRYPLSGPLTLESRSLCTGEREKGAACQLLCGQPPLCPGHYSRHGPAAPCRGGSPTTPQPRR